MKPSRLHPYQRPAERPAIGSNFESPGQSIGFSDEIGGGFRRGISPLTPIGRNVLGQSSQDSQLLPSNLKDGIERILQSPSIAPSSLVLEGNESTGITPSKISSPPKFEFGIDPEISKLKKEVRILSQRNSDQKLFYEKKIIELEEAKNVMEKTAKQEQQKILKLEKDRNFLLQEEESLRKKCEELEATITKNNKEMETKIRTLKQENSGLHESILELQEKSKKKEQEMQTSIHNLTLTLNKREREVSEESRRLSIQNENRLFEQVQELQSNLSDAEMTIQDLRSKLFGYENFEAVKKQFEEQSQYLKELEISKKNLTKENHHLSELASKVPLLSEERNTLLQKLAVLDHFRNLCAELEIRNALYEKEKAQWASYLDKSDKRDFDSPTALTKKLATLRRENVILLEQQGLFKSQLHSKEKEIEDAKQLIEKLKAERQVDEDRKERDSKSLKRLEKMKSLHQKEVEFLRAQLDSFDTEQTVLVGTTIDKSKAERILHLEQLLAEHKQALDEFREDANAKDTEIASLQQKLSVQSSLPPPRQFEEAEEYAKLKQENANLLQECESLKRDVESLEAQLSVLEQRVSQGDFNPQTTKVLHLTMNPERMVQEERTRMIAALRAENEELLKKLRALSEGAMDEDDQPSLIGDSPFVLQQRNQLLEKKIQETELKMQRLKEIFGKKITEFREVCYTLTGYKIEMNENMFKLSSMFAESEADCLIFQRDRNSGMQLLENEYSLQIGNVLQRFLNRKNSIPAILSSLTLDLFEKQTFL